MVFITIPSTALLFLQNKKIQTALTQYLAEELGKKLDTRIEVGNISITFFNRFLVEDLYIEDQSGDTLLFSSKMKLTINKFNRSRKVLVIKRIHFNEADIHIKKLGPYQNNLKFIIEKLKNDKPREGSPFDFLIKRISFQDSRYRHSSPSKSEKNSPVNFNELDLREFNAKLSDLRIDHDTTSFQLSNISFTERSGFRLNNLRGKMLINPNFLNINNLYIETPVSEISASRFRFDFESFRDFEHFVEKVNLTINLRSSHLSISDLSFFSNVFEGMNEKLLMSGLLTGRINDISGERLLIAFRNYTGIKGSFNLIGLPDIKETFLHADIESFQTHSRDLNNFVLPNKKRLNLPEELTEMGTVRYSGKFTGYFDDFVTYGVLESNLGKLATDLLITPDQKGNLSFTGSVEAQALQIGKIIPNPNLLGNLSMSAMVDGSISARDISANLLGIVDSIDFYGYTYKNINLSGFLSEKTFDGSFDISDPNVLIDFNGKVDFSGIVPVFDFTADVGRLRPYYLNFSKSDPSYFASFLLTSNFTGINPDSLNGEIRIVNSFFQRSDEQLQIYDLTLSTENSADTSKLSIKSEVLDADFSGDYQISNLPASFKKMTAHFLPSFFNLGDMEESGIKKDTENVFEFSVHLKSINPVLSFFARDYQIGNNTFFSGNYSSSDYKTAIIGTLPEFGFKGKKWSDINFIIESDSIETQVTGITNQINITDDILLENIVFNSRIYSDTLLSNLRWENFSTPANMGSIELLTGLSKNENSKNPKVNIGLLPSFFVLNDTIWDIPGSQILIDSTSLTFDSLIIMTQNQKFLVNGIVSDEKVDMVKVEVDNFDIATLNQFIQKPQFFIQGFATGYASLSDPYNSPLFLSDISINDFKFNNEFLGEGVLKTRWNNKYQKLYVLAGSRIDRSDIFEIEGDYYPEDQSLDFDIKLNKLKLSSLNPITKNILTDIKGLGFGELEVAGSLKRPIVNGKLEFFKSSFVVNYLQTRYSFTDEVNISANNIYFSNFEVYDESGNSGKLNGLIGSKYFREFNLNLNFTSDYFSFLNTRE